MCQPTVQPTRRPTSPPTLLPTHQLETNAMDGTPLDRSG
jgi:hypothetical protein